MLSSYQYGSVVVLALHCLYFVYLAAKRPYRSRVMTVRNLINEGAILVVLAIVVYYVFAGKSDDLTAELAIWVVIASLIVLGTYAMLIQSWRMLLAGWGSPLGYAAAVP